MSQLCEYLPHILLLAFQIACKFSELLPLICLVTFLLVKDIAKLLTVNQSRVLGWIHRGELVAINTSDPGRRPRWKIRREAFEEFCASRSNAAGVNEQPRPRRRKQGPDVTEYV